MHCKGLPDLLPLPGSRVTHTAGVCVCLCARKYWHWPRIKLSDTGLPPHLWTTVRNKRDVAALLRRKRDRWRQSEIYHECWDCISPINVWREHKSFTIEYFMYYYAWLLTFRLSNSDAKQKKNKYCTLKDHPHNMKGKNKWNNTLSFKLFCWWPLF